MARAVRPETPDLYICGWRLRTGLSLPAALSWPELSRGAPDLTFSAGRVPVRLENPVLDLEVLQIGSRGTALVRFQGIGRFLIHKRRMLTALEIRRDAAERTAVTFGNVAAAICWRRAHFTRSPTASDATR
jgi:hypothetical protein